VSNRDRKRLSLELVQPFILVGTLPSISNAVTSNSYVSCARHVGLWTFISNYHMYLIMTPLHNLQSSGKHLHSGCLMVFTIISNPSPNSLDMNWVRGAWGNYYIWVNMY